MESIPHKHCPVLVVDDDEGLLLSIKATLVSSGLPEPALVSDSRRVLDLVREHEFQLILLDLMMPDVDGWEVYRQMKADKELADIPVIIITARTQSIDKVLGLKVAKVADYITKPFGPGDLVDSIRRVLDNTEEDK